MPSLNFSSRVPVIDANIRVGDTPTDPSPVHNPEQLLAELDRFGVERGIVYHGQAETDSPIDGNSQLEQWLDDNERLIPQWMVMPTKDSLVQVRNLHRENRVRCVRLYDARPAGLPFRGWCYDNLLSWLNEERIPIWIPLTEADPHELVTTLKGYPELVTVLVGAHYTDFLLIRHMMTNLPKTLLELSRYEPTGQVETLRDDFGADRLLYGSWYPRYAMGPILYYLHHTNLTDPELRMVCAKNAERILLGGKKG